MHRLGERLIWCAPLPLVVGSACSSDETTVLGVNTPGTYPYHCTIHGAASMSGTIVVQ